MGEKRLFDEVMLGSLPVKNRLVRSATWEALALPDGGIPDELYRVYDELAAGGVGTIITGVTAVVPDGDDARGGHMRLDRDELVPQYRVLTERVHAHGAAIISQLGESQFFDQGRPWAVNDVSVEQIHRFIAAFGAAAARAQEAGFDGVQIHAAHFLFLSKFISPAVNYRWDDYGGSTQRRARILRDIVAEVHSCAPKLHVSMKINAFDRAPNGLEPWECFEIVEGLADAGLESVELSANGTIVVGVMPGPREGYFFDDGQQLAEEVAIPVILVGGHRSIEHMEQILNTSKIEFLSLSRPLMREPDLPARWQAGDTTPSRCISCNACCKEAIPRCVFVDEDGARSL